MSRRAAAPDSGLRVAVVTIVVLALGVAVLLASPRHRAFYFGPRRSPGGAFSGLPFARRPGAPPPARVDVVIGGREIPTADARGRIRVPLADRSPWRLPADGVPAGWDLKTWSGEALVELLRVDGRLAIRMRSERAAFALHRDVVLDPARYPFLTWSWKVRRLPAPTRAADPGASDHPAGVYIVFPHWPAPLTSSDVLGYVWDARAPVGATGVNPRAPNVHVLVVESGAGQLDQWVTYERNLDRDYRALFGHAPPRVAKVALVVDGTESRGDGEAFFGDLAFSASARGRTETPTPMLR